MTIRQKKENDFGILWFLVFSKTDVEATCWSMSNYNLEFIEGI